MSLTLPYPSVQALMGFYLLETGASRFEVGGWVAVCPVGEA